jgi:hypothetical protein
MAKKSTRKPSEDTQESTSHEEVGTNVSAEEVNTTVVEETTSSKARMKTSDDGSANGSVGISDIRKAVAFANSVGGLDKALGLLQILKVAREVQ